MDHRHVESEHVIERYLAGELTMREARAFEKYCLEHPEVLKSMPIPVRLKARLSRQPLAHSETGMFPAIPSSATHAALAAGEEGFDPEEQREEQRRSFGAAGLNRLIAGGLAFGLIVAIGAAVIYGMRASATAQQMKDLQREQRTTQLQAPSGVQSYRVQPVRSPPDRATLSVGWLVPAQLLELHIDVSQGKYTSFQVTIDKVDVARVLQLRRIARDSNGELRLALNSSAFGPGEYLVKIDGYTWRGQTQDVGWLRLDLR